MTQPIRVFIDGQQIQCSDVRFEAAIGGIPAVPPNFPLDVMITRQRPVAFQAHRVQRLPRSTEIAKKTLRRNIKRLSELLES